MDRVMNSLIVNSVKEVGMTKQIIETFREVDNHELWRLKQEKPSLFNGICRVTKYRVTVEEVEEPDEVIKARILKLWEDKNPMGSMDRRAIRAAAKKYGVELK